MRDCSGFGPFCGNLEWLRKQKGYQTRINAVLRAYMQANVMLSRPSGR
jgi:hypothetical protein